MNETEIAFSGDHDTRGWCVKVLKFANFSFSERESSEPKENTECNKDTGKEIVEMEIKKIISDYVDFDEEGEQDEADDNLFIFFCDSYSFC